MIISADVRWLRRLDVPFISKYTQDSIINSGLEVNSDSILVVDSDSEIYIRTEEDLRQFLKDNFPVHDADLLSPDEFPEKGLCYVGHRGKVDETKFDKVYDIQEDLFDPIAYYKLAHITARLRTISTLLIMI